MRFWRLFLCLNCLPLAPMCLKWAIISGTVPAIVVFHLSFAAANPQGRKCDSCMYVVAMSCNFLVAYFIVLHTLLTAWGAGTGPPVDSQVGKPLMRVFHFPTSSGYEHPLHSLDFANGFWCAHPCPLGCNRNDASSVTAYSRVGEPVLSIPFIRSFV